MKTSSGMGDTEGSTEGTARADGVLVSAIRGHVTASVASSVLTVFHTHWRPGLKAWLIDCRETTSYDTGGIAAGTKVIIEARKKVTFPIVVVATSPVIKMAVATVSMASGGRLQRFDDMALAERFLSQLAPA
jgi:hypothetical protein